MDELRARTVLVTGADGFIGSHVVERLLRDGVDVRAFCLYNSNGSLGWLDGLDADQRETLDVRLGDIRDARFVDDAVAGCDVVLHLAALIAIPYSYAAPASYVETNVMGTLNVLEAARRHGLDRVVHTSTSEVYGTPESVPITESHPLRAQSPYSASKIGADKLAEAYAASFDLPVVTLRPFNTFGPRQSLRAVIPTILAQLLAGQEEIRLGALDPRRDFTYVEDTVDGFVRMATAALPAGTVVQLGTGRDVSIGELAEACMGVVGHRADVIEDPDRVRPPGSEVERLLSDPTQAHALLGWQPTTSMEAGLAAVAAWLQRRPDLTDAHRYRT